MWVEPQTGVQVCGVAKASDDDESDDEDAESVTEKDAQSERGSE